MINVTITERSELIAVIMSKEITVFMRGITQFTCTETCMFGYVRKWDKGAIKRATDDELVELYNMLKEAE